MLNSNDGKSAASFFWQVAAQVLDMFCECYLVKIHTIANNSTTTKEIEKKTNTDLESFEF
jgi:hypothetical protein